MPVKRHAGKARTFEDYHRQHLLEGPDACLLAGVGYLAHISGGSFDRASPEEQATVLDEMRAARGLHGSSVDYSLTPPLLRNRAGSK